VYGLWEGTCSQCLWEQYLLITCLIVYTCTCFTQQTWQLTLARSWNLWIEVMIMRFPLLILIGLIKQPTTYFMIEVIIVSHWFLKRRGCKPLGHGDWKNFVLIFFVNFHLSNRRYKILHIVVIYMRKCWNIDKVRINMTTNGINLVNEIHCLLYQHIIIINPFSNVIPKTYNFVAISPHKCSLMKITSVVV